MEVQLQPGLIHSALLIDQLIREKLSNFTGNVAQFKKAKTQKCGKIHHTFQRVEA